MDCCKFRSFESLIVEKIRVFLLRLDMFDIFDRYWIVRIKEMLQRYKMNELYHRRLNLGSCNPSEIKLTNLYVTILLTYQLGRLLNKNLPERRH